MLLNPCAALGLQADPGACYKPSQNSGWAPGSVSAHEVAHWVKVLTIKPEGLDLNPGSHRVGED